MSLDIVSMSIQCNWNAFALNFTTPCLQKCSLNYVLSAYISYIVMINRTQNAINVQLSVQKWHGQLFALVDKVAG